MGLFDFFKKKEFSVSSVKEFWKWFLNNEKSFSLVIHKEQAIHEKFIDPLSEKLEALGDKYYFLVGINQANEIELIFSAEGVVKNVVFVEELVENAPIINGWKFIALKPSLKIDDINIQMQGYSFTSEHLFFEEMRNELYPDEIAIVVYYHSLNTVDEPTISNGVYIYLDNLLGEINLINHIDHIKIESVSKVEDRFIPIKKLKDYLNWRMKEFVEKYEIVKYDIEEEIFSLFESREDEQLIQIFVINQSAMNWNYKASHPWIAEFNIKFANGDIQELPSLSVIDRINDTVEEMLQELKSKDGYIYIGKRTSFTDVEIHFACKEFRKPSKVFQFFHDKYENEFEINSKIFKDKYWQIFSQFMEI